MGPVLVAAPLVPLLLVVLVAPGLTLGQRVLAAVAIVLALAALFWDLRRQLLADERLAELAQLTEAVGGGALHVFLPASGLGTLARLARAINGVATLARADHLERELDRAVDRTIVREAPSGVLVVAASGRVVRFNPAAARMLGSPADNAALVVGASAPAALAGVVERVLTSRSEAEITTTIGRLDLVIRGVPLADGADCLLLVHDISSLRRAERVRREFVANVSHELKTPITTILAYLETLTTHEQLAPDVQNKLDAVRRNAERLRVLTEDVLHLSRLEARDSDLPLEVELLRPILEDVVDRHRYRASQRGLQVELEVPQELDALTNADALDHAVSNLLDNAITYGTEGGTGPPRVRLRAFSAPGRVIVEVADHGRGIDPVHHDRIFERFYRVDEGRARGSGGTGLGLALVKHLCLVIRAEVRVESELTKGTRFRISLPTAPEDPCP